MKILIIADEHGSTEITESILKNNTFDYKIHVGDSLESIEWLEDKFDKYVIGNNDFDLMSKKINREENFNLTGINFTLFHGDRIVSMQLDFNNIVSSVKPADVYIFGHNHTKEYKVIDNKYFINPGSIGLPRDGKQGSYGILEINDNKEITFKHIMV